MNEAKSARKTQFQLVTSMFSSLMSPWQMPRSWICAPAARSAKQVFLHRPTVLTGAGGGEAWHAIGSGKMQMRGGVLERAQSMSFAFCKTRAASDDERGGDSSSSPRSRQAATHPKAH